MSLDEAATGPFAQFQNSPDEEDAITGLVVQLIRRHPQAAPRDEAVRHQVQMFRETVNTLLASRKKEPHQHAARVDETSAAKLFEEVKVLVRDVPDRVARELGNDPSMRRMRKPRRFHPMLIEELFHHPMFRESGSLPILMIFSAMREDYPWLYELGMQLYHAIEVGNPRTIERARTAIIDMIQFNLRAPFMRELFGYPEDGEALMMFEHLLRNLERLIPGPKRLMGKSDLKTTREGE